ARGRALRHPQARRDRSRPVPCGLREERQRRSSVNPQLNVSRGARALRKGAKSSATGGVAASLRDSLGKTGRRLTSDPIRTSLGLLPSGPDPVGEWLVHRQSPGPYLGLKAPENKRGGTGFAGLE